MTLSITQLTRPIAVALLAIFSLLGCTSNQTRYESPNRRTGASVSPPTAAAAPNSLPATVTVALDLGIDVFDAGIENLDSDQKITTASLRRAEAHYIPKVLANTLTQRAVWGIVRVIPNKQTEMDVWVDGEIIESDGTQLALRIKVTDATGLPWYTREYREEVDRYAYDRDPTVSYQDPFQSIYERIADDLQREVANRDTAALQEIRAVAQLQFAQRFSPDQFAGYLAIAADGRTRVERLPALDDPALRRMADLRARDLVFADSLDRYFADYTREMQPSYDRWRAASREEKLLK